MWRLVTEGGPAPFDGAQGRPSIQGGELEVASEEPLKRELADFVGAITSGRAPVVTGEAGRRALEVAQQIVDKMAADTRS